MILLKHNNFEFKNILRNGYKVLPNIQKVVKEIEMADGTIKRNYGEMPKTQIRVKFGELDKDTYRQYISHFNKPEDVYEYYDPNDGNRYTKKFFVERQEDSLIYVDDIEETHEEFEIILNQCGEV